MPDIIKAKKKDVKEIQLASLNTEDLSPKTECLKMELPDGKAAAKILAGNVHNNAKELLHLLKEEANVL